jgi:hypothetical protein
MNNLNAVVFQVRSRGDVMYPSQFEPYASSITGKLGGKPDYDPLKFAVDEAHNYGLEFHAWWNVCKVADGDNPPPLSSPAHIALTHPEWLKRWKNKNGNAGGSVEWWLDIGYPQVRSRLIDVAMELVEKYDIDAVNFDYLRYPGPEFDDFSSYAMYGGDIPKDEWHRSVFIKIFRKHPDGNRFCCSTRTRSSGCVRELWIISSRSYTGNSTPIPGSRSCCATGRRAHPDGTFMQGSGHSGRELFNRFPQ